MKIKPAQIILPAKELDRAFVRAFKKRRRIIGLASRSTKEQIHQAAKHRRPRYKQSLLDDE
jgi:hypothetical protein